VDDVIMDEFHYYSDHSRGAAWRIPLLTRFEKSPALPWPTMPPSSPATPWTSPKSPACGLKTGWIEWKI
jgi:hypothetical protein